MASLNSIIEEVATSFGMVSDKKHTIAHGTYQGFPVLLHGGRGRYSSEIQISIWAQKDEMPIEPEHMGGVILPKHGKVLFNRFNRFRVTLSIPVGNKKETVAGVADAVFSAIRALSGYGYTGCDDMGVTNNWALYSLKGEFVFLSSEAVSRIQIDLGRQKNTVDMTSENYLLGTLGALGGAILGSLLVLLIARIGFVSALGNVLMAAAVVFAYKKLGKKFTVVSAIITAVIGVSASYLVFRIDATMTLAKAVSGYAISFGELFRDCREYYEAFDSMAVYWRNFALMMLAGVIGIVGMIAIMLKSEKEQFELKRIG